MNSLAKPKIERIVLNMGIKEAASDKKILEMGSLMLSIISGQKPKVTRAKKSIASFKLRAGDSIGLTVTLRGKKMQSFYKRLVSIVLPRVKDFHGVSVASFDGKGNYSLGFRELFMFPEIDPAKIDRPLGVEVTIVTTAKDNDEGKKLLEEMGMPFKKY